MVAKGRLIAFKLDDELMENLQKLSKRLNYNQSETVRLALQQLIEQHLETQADIIILDRAKWDAITSALSKRLIEEIRQEFMQEAVKQVRESPEIQMLIKAAKENRLEIEES